MRLPYVLPSSAIVGFAVFIFINASGNPFPSLPIDLSCECLLKYALSLHFGILHFTLRRNCLVVVVVLLGGRSGVVLYPCLYYQICIKKLHYIII